MSRGDSYCRKFLGFVPSFEPIVRDVSPVNVRMNTYQTVNIVGNNFLPYDVTYVELQNQADLSQKIKVLCGYGGSKNLFFIVPREVASKPGTYFLRVVTVLDGQLSLGVANTYPPQLVYSAPTNFVVRVPPQPA